MSSRTQTWNAFETTLDATLNPGILFGSFTSVTNLSFPVYVTLAPEDPTKLEYLKIIDIIGTTVEFEQRNLDGSAGDGTHAPGTIVRLTWTKQLQDDIFNDVEALEAEDIVLAAADVSHAALVDVHHVRYTDTEADARAALQDHDHTTPITAHAGDGDAHHVRYTDTEARSAVDNGTYLKLTGGLMSGILNMGNGDISVVQRISGNTGQPLLIGNGAESRIAIDSPELELSGANLQGPADPFHGGMIGDRDYNDTRYVLQ